jgi:hypothetical protein
VRPRAAARLAWQSIRRGRRAFLLSVFGISVGIAALTFFLALSAGARERVLRRLFPPGRLEVVPARAALDPGPLGGLLPGPRPLTDEALAALRALPDVAAVYPRMKVAFPVRGWGGEQVFGRPLPVELIIDGIDPSAVTEKTAPIEFADHWGKPGRFCTEDANCEAPAFCAWDINRCERPIPVLVSPLLLEIYNSTIAKAHHLPRIGSFLASRFRGLTFTAELGRSYVTKQAVGTPRQRRLMLVGLSSRAVPIGITVPLPYVQRWNAEYAGDQAGKEYSSLSIELTARGSVTRVVEAVRRLGYAIEDNGAEQAGLAATLIGAVLVLVSLLIVLVAVLNVGHMFFRAVAERRRELGVMRALGASARDVEVLLLAEAGAIGAAGGFLGLLWAYLGALGIDLVSQRLLPEFPFKPDSYFLFSSGLCAFAVLFSIGVCLLGAYLPARAAARMAPAAALTAT